MIKRPIGKNYAAHEFLLMIKYSILLDFYDYCQTLSSQMCLIHPFFPFGDSLLLQLLKELNFPGYLVAKGGSQLL